MTNLYYSVLENRIICSSELDENLDEDGNINWDYVHADVYADVRILFKDDKTFDEYFNDIVDDLIHRMDEVSNQYEMTKYRIVTKFKNGQMAETIRGTEVGMIIAVETIRADDQVEGVNVFEEVCIIRDFA